MTLSGLPKRVRHGVLIGMALLVIVPVLQCGMGASEAFRVAEASLAANEEVHDLLGPDVEVAGFGWVRPSAFSWSAKSTYATYYLRVVGQDGAIRARVELEKGSDDQWGVRSVKLQLLDAPASADFD
jgi:hypothetical protein